MAAAKLAASSVNLASRLSAPSRYGRKSTHLGSVANRFARTGGRDMFSRAKKSPTDSSQTSSPLVSPISSVSIELWSSQYATSLLTHFEAAASGEASNTK